MEDRDRLPAEFERLTAPSSAYAERKVAVYFCPREHVMSVPFAIEAEPPESWDCRCGQTAKLLVGDGAPAADGSATTS